MCPENDVYGALGDEEGEGGGVIYDVAVLCWWIATFGWDALPWLCKFRVILGEE